MNFNDLVRDVVNDTVGAQTSLWAHSSLWVFRAELTLCATIIAVLLVKTFAPAWKNGAFHITMLGLIAAVCLAFYTALLGLAAAVWPSISWRAPSTETALAAQPIFTGTLLADSFTVVVRGLLLLFAALWTTFTQIAGGGDQDDRTEFYVLVLGALVGMCLMISANHLLIVLLGVEMASVPCYVLAGYKRRQSTASEAALKYAVFGAGTAGVMLFGLSLLAGELGTAQLPAMTARLAAMIHPPAGQAGITAGQTTILALGGLMVTVGLAFKLSAVPFHFWAPDVFEGATAEVAAFLSVASKTAALGLLMRLCAGFSFPTSLFPLGLSLPADPVAAVAYLAPVRQYIVAIVSVLAAVTCTFGNLAAYGQTNMKRLLAYSTIAHAGYMMMPVAAAVALVGTNVEAARGAVAALVVYMGIYLFMNLAAFAIVAFLRNATGSEQIADYAGLSRRSPGLAVCMAIVMFSLVGLPPLAGFQAKWVVFYALIDAARTASPGLWALLAIGLLNTVLSLFYYLRVVRVMVFSPEPLYRAAPTIPLTSMVGSYCALLTLPVVLLFFELGGLLEWAKAAASTLFY